MAKKSKGGLLVPLALIGGAFWITSELAPEKPAPPVSTSCEDTQITGLNPVDSKVFTVAAIHSKNADPANCTEIFGDSSLNQGMGNIMLGDTVSFNCIPSNTPNTLNLTYVNTATQSSIEGYAAVGNAVMEQAASLGVRACI